jgi:hypothetical protein
MCHAVVELSPRPRWPVNGCSQWLSGWSDIAYRLAFREGAVAFRTLVPYPMDTVRAHDLPTFTYGLEPSLPARRTGIGRTHLFCATCFRFIGYLRGSF